VPQKSRIFTIGSAILVVALILGWWAWPTREVKLSREGYELSKALYSVCNLRDSQRLMNFESKLQEYSLAPDEMSRVQSILDLAKVEQWDAASSRARALLESQETP
jgi:hypothetical protein